MPLAHHQTAEQQANVRSLSAQVHLIGAVYKNVRLSHVACIVGF